MTQPSTPWVVDPDDPRAPPEELWARMTPDERARVVASLPSGTRLRFFHGTAPLPEADELVAKLESMFDGLEHRARAAEERAEQEARLRAEEARLRQDAEQRLAEALAEIERLKREAQG